MTGPSPVPASDPLAARHVRIGWVAVATFTVLGLVLEALHGFKVAGYVDVDVENRRLLLTLAHAHGTLLGLLHLGLAATAHHVSGASRTWASRLLTAATVVLPAGFLLGGLWLSGTDPGPGVFLVPVGGLLMLGGAVAAALATR